MSHATLRVRDQDDLCFVQLHRPEANNTINAHLVAELSEVVARCVATTKVIVLEGLPEVFCAGADFQAIAAATSRGDPPPSDPGPLYDLWTLLATGPFVTIAHVRGKANAGGIGFVAACDIVIADDTAQFSLSELLFGLLPACVLPFLIRRVGLQRASYLTLMTQPISSAQALTYGLVDAVDANSEDLVRRHLLRLRRLAKPAIARHKRYLAVLDPRLAQARTAALTANREVFTDVQNLQAITGFIERGDVPWRQP